MSLCALDSDQKSFKFAGLQFLGTVPSEKFQVCWASIPWYCSLRKVSSLLGFNSLVLFPPKSFKFAGLQFLGTVPSEKWNGVASC